MQSDYQAFGDDDKNNKSVTGSSASRLAPKASIFPPVVAVLRESVCQGVVDHLVKKTNEYITGIQWSFSMFRHPQVTGRAIDAARNFLTNLESSQSMRAIHKLVDGVEDKPLQEALRGFLKEKGAERSATYAPPQ